MPAAGAGGADSAPTGPADGRRRACCATSWH